MNDRLPPHSQENEQGILGCLFLSPNEAIGACVERGLDPDAFYDLRHQTIYENILAMYDAREVIDIITVQQKLKDKQLLEKVGGIGYLSSLSEAVPSAANLPAYVEIVEEKHTLRRIIQSCTETLQKAYEEENDVEEVVDGFESAAIAIRAAKASTGQTPIKTLVRDAIGDIEAAFERKGALSGIGSGFADLDKATGGFQQGEMVVIAARPSAGKTSLGMNIAENVVLEQQLPVGVFSLEMTSRSLVRRLICSRSRVNLKNARDGFLCERDFPRLTSAAGQLSKAPIYIDETSGMSIQQLRAKARRMVQQHGIKLFVIDYLQMLHSTSKKAENRQQEVADISSGIKNMAKELNVPVIVLSQLNREMERDKHRKPRLSDLRESGAIEQDADIILMLYRPPQEDPDADDNTEAVAVNALVAKQRNGDANFDIHLTFLKPYTRFESAAKVYQEDLPTTKSPTNDD